ncbi:MAG: hypothetical protein ACK4K9_05550 [Bacteroidia bacterium]
MQLFTSDIDWAPEEVIADMLNLFEQYSVKCTLFVTHDSEVIHKCNRELFEIAIHPNFNNRLFAEDKRTPKEIVQDLLDMYPEAVGMRSHSMTQSSQLLNVFAECGLQYDSNQFLPYQQVKPYKCWTGLTRIPYNWEDDVHFTYGKAFTSDGFGEYNGLRIYDFHPIHVFLNTDSNLTYLKAKPFYNNFHQISFYKNSDVFGTRDLLIKLLSSINNSNLHLKELNY